jgi:hypothetical protein
MIRSGTVPAGWLNLLARTDPAALSDPVAMGRAIRRLAGLAAAAERADAAVQSAAAPAVLVVDAPVAGASR